MLLIAVSFALLNSIQWLYINKKVDAKTIAKMPVNLIVISCFLCVNGTTYWKRLLLENILHIRWMMFTFLYKVSAKPTLWKILTFTMGTSATFLPTPNGRLHSVFFHIGERFNLHHRKRKLLGHTR